MSHCVNRALSIRQPYAESIIRGEKTIEYRTRPTEIRGRVLIYASKCKEDETIFHGYEIESKACDFGKIIGSVEIVSVERSYEFPEWYEWHLANPERVPEPWMPSNRALPVFWYPKKGHE